ncbi:MAG: NADH-quinone oxidoreductase subunit I [Holophagaceae bacterium]|nr:NADH-quinone oxidoreductase subunit I [Holophagaceae bacterium]
MNKILRTLIPFDIVKGLSITGKHFAKVFFSANRRKVPFHITSEYPEVPAKVQPRYRGRLTLLKDEQGEIKCVCCLACEKICPTQVITIEKGKKEGRKMPFPVRYDFEMERCIFCEFCVESCGFDSIILNHQFELAAYNREDFSIGMEGLGQNMYEPSPVGKFSVADD